MDKNWAKEMMTNAVESLIDFDEIPQLSDADIENIAEELKGDLIDRLDADLHFSEIVNRHAQEAVMENLNMLPVKGVYGLTNNGSLNVYYALDDRVFAAQNGEGFRWCEITDNGEEEGFWYPDTSGYFVPLSMVMHV